MINPDLFLPTWTPAGIEHVTGRYAGVDGVQAWGKRQVQSPRHRARRGNLSTRIVLTTRSRLTLQGVMTEAIARDARTRQA